MPKIQQTRLSLLPAIHSLVEQGMVDGRSVASIARELAISVNSLTDYVRKHHTTLACKRHQDRYRAVNQDKTFALFILEIAGPNFRQAITKLKISTKRKRAMLTFLASQDRSIRVCHEREPCEVLHKQQENPVIFKTDPVDFRSDTHRIYLRGIANLETIYQGTMANLDRLLSTYKDSLGVVDLNANIVLDKIEYHRETMSPDTELFNGRVRLHPSIDETLQEMEP